MTFNHDRPRGAGYQRHIADRVLRRARWYVHRSRRTVRGLPADGGPLTRSQEIKVRVAANAEKRARIAEAMKREAGVKAHTFTHENGGGVAFLASGNIVAPAGENIRQLATLAHECSHVFLHRIGTPGARLPSHVKEWEAERYAHQALVEHGMRVPKEVTDFGRQYVFECCVADQEAGHEIDLRAVAYAVADRDPYEPLRKVPSTWKLHRAAPMSVADRWAEWRASWWHPTGWLRVEVGQLGKPLLEWGMAVGYLIGAAGAPIARWYWPLPVLTQPGVSPEFAHLADGAAGMLLMTTLVMLVISATRMPRE